MSPRPLLLLLLLPSVARAELDPRIPYLLHVREVLGTGRPGDLALGGLTDPREHAARWRARGEEDTARVLELATLGHLYGSLRLDSPRTPALEGELAALGVEPLRPGWGGSLTVVPVRIPWDRLEEVAAHPAVVSVAPAWRLSGLPPLAQSRPQVEAEQVWRVELEGLPLTGAGVRVADLDTGVSYLHPALFFSDGPEFSFVDADRSGAWSAGDYLDLNSNGKKDAGEELRWQEAGGAGVYGNDGGYDLAFDWLYLDTNGNGRRDSGAGFGEDAPSYGEALFQPVDRDADGALDAGESVIRRDSSKVLALRETTGEVYRRGVNLLQAPTDTYGHGTPVTGILAGGWPGHAMAGLAPDVELLHAHIDWEFEAPFLLPIEDHLSWTVEEGADVVLIEDGEWVWQFMDGSSNVEWMLGEMAAAGVLIVIPAGNLSTGQMHTQFPSSVGTTWEAAGGAAVGWLTFLWQGEAATELRLTGPDGARLILGADGGTQTLGRYEVYSMASASERGTRRLDVRLAGDPGQGAPNLYGPFTFALDISDDPNVHAYFYDSASSWGSDSAFEVIDPTSTVTWPATADGVVSVAAYDPAGGEINSFSGWGPRIDGAPDVTVAAPGSVVYSTSAFNMGDFTAFGGTSSAGPHVAAAAALLKQARPELGQQELIAALQAGALADAAVDDPDRWGAGKLRIAAALTALGVEGVPTPSPTPSPSPSPTPFPLPDGCETSQAPGGGAWLGLVVGLLGLLVGRRR